ncbi:MAG TPA: hypothetical protein VK999_03340, partial [Methylotenera sp.]|nr:hypothetical protein [Methylotenera sp.]
MSYPSVFNEYYFKYLASAQRLLPAALIMLLSACSVTQQVSDDEIRSRYVDITPQQAMQQASERYSQAGNEHYEYFAATSWKLAGEALNEARKIASQQPDSLQILKQTYMFDKHLDSAAYIKSSALNKFQTLLQLKDTLQKNHAEQSYALKFDAMKVGLAQLLVDYESLTLGVKTEDATQKNVDLKAIELENAMQLLNVNVVKFNYLNTGKKDLKKLAERKAAELVPVTYSEAVNRLANAELAIEEDAYDEPAIAEGAKQFRFALDHAAHILDSVIELSTKEVKQLESVVLQHEQNIHDIAQALKVDDSRNKSLGEQKQILMDKIAGVYDHHSEKSSMIIELSEENMQLQAEMKSMKQLDIDANEKLLSQINSLQQDIA